jgi:hypothetical protein
MSTTRATVRARRNVVKDIWRAKDWMSEPPPPAEEKKFRVAIVDPGPPGIGKTRAALKTVGRKNGGRLLGPTHGQAAERKEEIKALARVDVMLQPGPDEGKGARARHIQGLGRKCNHMKRDVWAQHGWTMAEVACSGCPDKGPNCAAMRQFWTEPTTLLGVHSMQHWDYNGPLFIDEQPNVIDLEIVDEDVLNRLYALNSWARELRPWLTPVHLHLRRVVDTLGDAVYAFDDINRVPAHGIYLPTNPFRDKRSSGYRALRAVLKYVDENPIPPPPAARVRAKTIAPNKWVPPALFRALARLYADANNIAVKHTNTRILLQGDPEGKLFTFQIETRTVEIPAAESHVILDSYGKEHMFLYRALYGDDFELKLYHRGFVPEYEGVELVHFDTLGFSRGRSLDFLGALTPKGANARIRALREVLYRGLQLKEHETHRPRVGLIDHKAVLEALGFEFYQEGGVLQFRTSTQGDHRAAAAEDREVERMLCELQENFDLIVGYHGGVTGSNQFVGVNVLAILGDPYGNIGSLQQDADVLGVDRQAYITNDVTTKAKQEIFRARLIDAGEDDRKTILYFGRVAPEIPGLTWNAGLWREGGRIPSRLRHSLTAALWGVTGANKKAFIGTASPDVVRMHTTSMRVLRSPYSEAGEILEELSPKARETYRRVAKDVADAAGLLGFDVPHPFPNRKPLRIWATSREKADVLATQLRNNLRLQSPAMKRAIVADGPASDAAEARSQVLGAEREAIVESMKTLRRVRDFVRALLGMRTVLRDEDTKLMEGKRLRVEMKAQWADVREADLDVLVQAWLHKCSTVQDVEGLYRVRMGQAVTRWKAMKMEWEQATNSTPNLVALQVARQRQLLGDLT